MKTLPTILAILAAVCLIGGGCAKQVEITVANHSDMSRSIQLTVPDETMTLGTVGAGGKLTSMLKVKNENLPAQCALSAGAGATTNFMVTANSPAKWWFHVTADGRLAGPYGKDDVHVETEDLGEVESTIRRGAVVR